jgi:hypothetical protein
VKAPTKYILAAVAAVVVLLLSAVAYLIISAAPRFADRVVDARFLEQLRMAAVAKEGWTTKPEAVALRLVAADLFPPGRPSQTNASVRVERSWSGRYCTVSVLEGFFEQGTVVMCTYDRVTLQQEGSVWIPVRRKVSWQTTKRPGWRTDLP